MSEKPLPELNDLQDKIDALNPRRPSLSDPGIAPVVAGSLRLGVEIAAGVLLGAAIGFALDKWLGTLPLFFLIFFVLGCAASFVNLRRTIAALDNQEQSATTVPDSNEQPK